MKHWLDTIRAIMTFPIALIAFLVCVVLDGPDVQEDDSLCSGEVLA